MPVCKRCGEDWSRGDRDEPAYPCACDPNEIPDDGSDDPHEQWAARSRDDDDFDFNDWT